MQLIKDTSNGIQQHQQHNSNSNQVRECAVCNGKGYLPIKSKLIQSQNQVGVITSRRNRPLGWVEFGHMPPSVQAVLANNKVKQQEGDEQDIMMGYAIQLLAKANGIDDDYTSKRNDVPIDMALIEKNNNDNNTVPNWLPINPGEQLCNLVGRWKILQRVASHRWTTDDLVTAYVAASTFVSSQTSGGTSSANKEEEGETLRYLDLGTGNASVLQMSTWYLLSTLHSNNSKYKKIEAVGVEARSEAVGLARRSLSFNLGSVEYQGKVYTGGCAEEGANDSEELKHDVQIVQEDFRNLVSLSSSEAEEDTASSSSATTTPDIKSMVDIASKRYDLITGTPPYFRVGFTKSSNTADNTSDNNESITSAVIEEGGMPTSKQSAPARCEFRGGIEAYCLTASAMLSQPHGRFVVCENWLNNHRVWSGAKEAGLIIESVQPVRGGVRKEHNLFAVYVMKKKGNNEEQKDERDVVLPALVVRDEHGNWTKEYARVMQSMSIPVL